jgi:hypothetical protein
MKGTQLNHWYLNKCYIQSENNSVPGDMSAANMPIQATLPFGNIWAVGTLQLGSLATFQSQMSEKVCLP